MLDIKKLLAKLLGEVPVVLFDQDSNYPFPTQFALSDNSSNYKKLTIILKNNDNVYTSVEVHDPYNKKFSISDDYTGTNSTSSYMKHALFQINATNISFVGGAQIAISGTTSPTFSRTYTQYMGVVKVLGVKKSGSSS